MSLRRLFPLLFFLHAGVVLAQVDSPLVPLLIALNLDGIDNKEVYRCYQDQQGRLWLNAADLKLMGFPAMKHPPFRYKERDYFPLDKYDGVEYALDENLWLLKISTPVSWHTKQIISNSIPLENSKLRPETPGVFLNYDASAGYNGFLKDNYTAAFTEAGLFSAYGVGTSGFLINGYDYLQQRNDVLRLDTAWTFDQPERISSWRFGDSISSGLSWSGAVRFAGIQYATNFATQPSLITMPQPNIYGEANLPSSIDVLVNGMNTQHQSVNKGSYEVTQVPVVTGKGAIQVVSTDMLGRQQINTFDYYASPLLLKPGLSNYSYELGSIRRAYANESFNYGRALGGQPIL